MTMIDQEPERFEDDNGTPEPQAQPQQPQQEILIDNPPQQQNGLKQAAALVPVGPHGAAPTTFENQITYAQAMAKAVAALPTHLRGNVGDCLAIIDIASRAGLSPYMVAQKTYVQNNRLAFESQLYHSFLIQSGWLKDTALHVKYDGEGDERTCTVWGTLRNETEPRSYTTPKFKDLHPGLVKKTVDGKEITYVKGSPLWNKKPDVQMFYDASRDWGRMFCPIATLGMMDAYEMTETPIGAAGAVEITGSGQGLHDRLSGADRTEGHQDGHVERELANVASDAATTIKPAKTTQDAPGETKPTPTKGKGKAAAKKTTTADPPRTTTLAKPKQTVSKAEAGRVADRAEAASNARKQTATQQTDPPAPAPSTLKDCKTAADYQVYAMEWIDKSGDPEAALERWEAERDARDDLTVRTPTRNALRSRLESKHGV